MAHLREKKGRYYAEFYDPDRDKSRKWLTLRTGDKQNARNKLSRLEKEEAMGLFDPWTDSVKEEGIFLSEAIDRYIAARSHLSHKTTRADRSVLELLRDNLAPDFAVDRVNEQHIDDFFDNDWTDSTTNTYYNRLNGFFNWCEQHDLIENHPMAAMKTPTVGESKVEFLSRDEYESLLQLIETDAEQKGVKDKEVVWLADVVRFAVGTGFRLSEICNLRWSAVDLTHQYITVKNTDNFKTKSGHERRVPIAGDALEVLERLNARRKSNRNGYVFTGTANRKGTKEKLNGEYVSKRFKYYVREDDSVSNEITFHSLRHTYASWLVIDGADIYRVQKLMGHADISTTMRYAHLAPDNLTSVVEMTHGG